LGFAFELDTLGVVHDAIQDGIGQRGVGDAHLYLRKCRQRRAGKILLGRTHLCLRHWRRQVRPQRQDFLLTGQFARVFRVQRHALRVVRRCLSWRTGPGKMESRIPRLALKLS